MPPKSTKSDSKAAALANENDKAFFLTERELRIMAQCVIASDNLGDIKPDYTKASAELGLAAGTVKNAWGMIKQKIAAEKAAKKGGNNQLAEDYNDEAQDVNPMSKKRARTSKTVDAAAAAGSKRTRARKSAPLITGKARLNPDMLSREDAAEEEDGGKKDGGDTTVDEDEAAESGVI